jgi:hypothetical protein
MSVTVIETPCPTCGACAGELCKRLTPGRYSHIDGYHKARKDAFQSGGSGPAT